MSNNSTNKHNYVYSDLTDEVHDLNNHYEDLEEENKNMQRQMAIMENTIQRLTEVVERQNTLSEDVRNLLNYTQAQQPDIQVSSEDECNNSLSRRIIPTDVPKTPKEFKEQKKRPKDEEKIRVILRSLWKKRKRTTTEAVE
ncbi:hypothetical protein G6F56_013601 [Rhizopus delemar]|nr:hypothetical protein G6F56_013601 [Rhizopus delemar]